MKMIEAYVKIEISLQVQNYRLVLYQFGQLQQKDPPPKDKPFVLSSLAHKLRLKTVLKRQLKNNENKTIVYGASLVLNARTHVYAEAAKYQKIIQLKK